MIAWFYSYPPVVDRASLSDADDLAEIHAASFHRGWSAAELESLIADERTVAVVARRGSPFGSRRPVGFVILRAVADEAEVLTLAVGPRQRGRGLGRLLMDEAIRRLYYNRIQSIFLEVDVGNQPALGLYARLGFREVGRRNDYYSTNDGKPATALVMRADITP